MTAGVRSLEIRLEGVADEIELHVETLTRGAASSGEARVRKHSSDSPRGAQTDSPVRQDVHRELRDRRTAFEPLATESHRRLRRTLAAARPVSRLRVRADGISRLSSQTLRESIPSLLPGAAALAPVSPDARVGRRPGRAEGQREKGDAPI